MAEDEDWTEAEQEAGGNPPERQRAPRSDRGQVRINDRDRQILRFIIEQRCISVDLLAILMERDESTARSWLKRHVDGGHLKVLTPRGPDGESVYAPTRAALQLLQLPFSPETPEQIAHLLAISTSRIYLQGASGCLERPYEWSSERARRSEHHRERREQEGTHFEDGVLNGTVAVEIELSPKSQAKLIGILRSLLAKYRRVIYIVGAQAAGALRHAQQLFAAEVTTLSERLIVYTLEDVQKAVRLDYERRMKERKSYPSGGDDANKADRSDVGELTSKAWFAVLGAAELIRTLDDKHVASAARLLADVTPLLVECGLRARRLGVLLYKRAELEHHAGNSANADNAFENLLGLFASEPLLAQPLQGVPFSELLALLHPSSLCDVWGGLPAQHERATLTRLQAVEQLYGHLWPDANLPTVTAKIGAWAEVHQDFALAQRMYRNALDNTDTQQSTQLYLALARVLLHSGQDDAAYATLTQLEHIGVSVNPELIRTLVRRWGPM